MIATGTAIALAAATAGPSIANAALTHNTNSNALKSDERDAIRQENIQKQAMANDQLRWNDYLRVHEPIWNTAGGTLQSLQSLAGLQPGAGPAIPQQGSAPPNAPIVGSRPNPNTPSLYDTATGGGPATTLAGRVLPRRPVATVQPTASRMPSLTDIARMASMGPASAPGAGAVENYLEG